MSAFAHHAHQLLANGYSPLPLKTDRMPFGGWKAFKTTPIAPDEIARRIQRYDGPLGLGVVGGYCHNGNYLVPIDVDTDEPAIVDAIVCALPPANVTRIGSKGWGALYRSRTPIAGRKFRPAGKAPLVEVLTTGMMVLPPTPHPKLGGAPYRWGLPATPFDTLLEDLVEIAPQHVADLEEALRPRCGKRKEAVTTTVVDCALIDDKRMAAFARSRVRNEAARMSGLGDGRYHAVYSAACVLGKFVRHRILADSEVRGALLGGCEANGLVRKYNRRRCDEWITRGFDKAASDPLPDLDQLPGAKPRRPSRWDDYLQMAAR